MSIKIIAKNRKARFNYSIGETYEAGVMLTGTEVKSLRAGKLNLSESYGVVNKSEIFWLNAHIPHYAHGNIHNHDPLRTRKLLLHAKEIEKLIGTTREKGVAIIPLKAYWKKGRVKLEIGVGYGKKLYDKRADQKDHDWKRQQGRILKGDREE